MRHITGEGAGIQNPHGAPVLIVIADTYLRVLVGSIVAQMDLAAILKPTWLDAVMATTGPLSCIVADLDDVRDKLAGVAVLRKSWGDDVPLIVLSHRPDVGEQAAAVGALAAIRQPMNVGALMQAIRRAVGETDESQYATEYL